MTSVKIYHENIQESEHILCFKFPFSKVLNLTISSSNFRDDLLVEDMKEDWFYGVGGGVNINSKNILADIGISSLGSAGFIYGISCKLKLN